MSVLAFSLLFSRGSTLAIDLAGWVVQNQVTILNLTRCSNPILLLTFREAHFFSLWYFKKALKGKDSEPNCLDSARPLSQRDKATPAQLVLQIAHPPLIFCCYIWTNFFLDSARPLSQRDKAASAQLVLQISHPPLPRHPPRHRPRWRLSWCQVRHCSG